MLRAISNIQFLILASTIVYRKQLQGLLKRYRNHKLTYSQTIGKTMAIVITPHSQSQLLKNATLKRKNCNTF